MIPPSPDYYPDDPLWRAAYERTALHIVQVASATCMLVFGGMSAHEFLQGNEGEPGFVTAYAVAMAGLFTVIEAALGRHDFASPTDELDDDVWS